ncbi:zinc finger CCCH domain-containing protein 6-like [Canna indica]|uniref:Zinc finger CCCH domain-containing protein 6-like n=1 Tax=Canna indica TaxID=4628 RepID=A0AAQ3QET6_9LILI|nr:zinc finger CCCH domain-containing protein 6-like [Canna indica]
MELYGRSPDPGAGLEESLWRLGLGGGGDAQYPERPGEQDCAYYMRTGTCSYGEKCRYNHPRDRGLLTGAGRIGAVEYPERVGQPVCEHYMRTGNCKFGSTCKYHHPRQGGGPAQPVSLNYSGYPLRPGEKECAFYIKTGQCKFGATCKFHHPQPAGTSVPSPAPAFYPTVQQLSVPSPHQYPPYVSWPVARPSVLPGSYMPASYSPMMVSPGVVPVQGWNPYAAPMNSAMSSSSQQTVHAGPIFGLQSQSSLTKPALPGPQAPTLSPAGPSSTRQMENKFPERPGQPECQFYMRTGDCKYGAMCKYHHPPDWSMPRTNVVLNPLGLPLRLGAQPCTYYMQHGLCKFGQTCKFDHPIATVNYSSSVSSLSDIPVAPYPMGFSVPTFTPSSSFMELQPEFISNKEHLSSRIPSEN